MLCDNPRMAAVLKLFWGICMLRSGPEAVPTHTWFLAALFGALVGVGVLVTRLNAPWVHPLVAFNSVALTIAVTASFAWFALYVRRQEARFPATLGALLGTSIVINCALLVGYQLTGGAVQKSLGLLFMAWSVVVAGFILHRALACKLWTGVALSLAASFAGVVVVEAALGSLLAPPAAEAPSGAGAVG